MIVVTPTQMMMKWWFNGNFSWWVGDGRPFMVSLFRDKTIAIRFWPWHAYNCLVLWNMIGLFSIYMGCHPKPIDFHSIIFQDGHSQHHQPVMVWSQWPFRTYEMLICWKNATMTTMFFFERPSLSNIKIAAVSKKRNRNFHEKIARSSPNRCLSQANYDHIMITNPAFSGIKHRLKGMGKTR
jgi:hypothetical protein